MKTKSLLALSLGIIGVGAALTPTSSSAAILLVGFNAFNGVGGVESPDESIAGFGGSTINKVASSSSAGSQDGFYGPDSVASGGFPVNNGSTANGRITNGNGTVMTVTNATGIAYPLLNLLFDATHNTGGGATSTTFNVAWTAPAGNGAANGLVANVAGTNYVDFIIDLGGLVLDSGESIVFTWTTTAGGLRLDNLGLSAVPEPGSLVALGCLVGSGLMLRRRTRRSVAN